MYGDQRERHVLTHSFPTRRSSDLSPWDTSRVPGWSSSGGAAAVAAGMLPVAIGSDGGGSTRLPAAYSGVVGMHPTGGLIPELDYAKPRPPAGITVGPLARSVRDAALVTQVMAGPDGRDPFSIQRSEEHTSE